LKKIYPNYKEIFTQKLSFKNIELVSGIRKKPIPDPESGVKKTPDPGPGSATLLLWSLLSYMLSTDTVGRP
jgi:hypothetical protein